MRPLVITFLCLALGAAPALAQQDAAPKPAPPAEQETVSHEQATSVLGRQVHDPSGQVVGRIVDVLVTEAGMPRAAVIDFGGFMGVGNRQVAVSWSALQFGPGPTENTITINLTQDQIKAIPDFKRPVTPADPPVTVAVPPHPAPAQGP